MSTTTAAPAAALDDPSARIGELRTSIGTDAWLALATVEAVFYGLLGLVVPLLRTIPRWPVWLAAAWTVMETVRSTWPFSGMPWGRLAFGAIDTPAAPAVALVGMTGLSFCLALVGFLLAGVIQSVAPLVRRTAANRPALGTLVLPGAALVGSFAGAWTVTLISAEGLRPLQEWMLRYHAFWPQRIEALKDFLREMDQ